MTYWRFILRNYDDGGGDDENDDDNICDLSVFILMMSSLMMVLMMMCSRLLMIDDMCRNQERFWEKIRFDETAAAFEIQKERNNYFVSCLHSKWFSLSVL